MITLLSSFFIKKRANTRDPQVRRQYGVLCGAVGIALNILLFIGKFAAGTLSASIAITADAFNNLSDAGSSLVTLLGFKLAGQKPDSGHPFGHGRIEYLSGMIVSILILLMGVELIKSSVEKILHPAAVNSSALVLLILVVSVGVKLYMYFYNHTMGTKLDSAAMKATALDSLSDSVATTAVLAATLVGRFSDLMIDGWCGLLVAAFIIYSGIMAAKETISPLLGQPPSPEFVHQIEVLAMAHPEVHGIHDLIVHDYGPGRCMISLHAEVPAHGDIFALHDAIDNIEMELKQTLGCDAVIHMDPIDTDDPEVLRLKEMVTEYIKKIDPVITLHDFRIVPGPTHTNIIFDVVLPFAYPRSDENVVEQIKNFVHTIDGHQYYAVIQVDHSYTGVQDEM